ncbi:MAG: cytochrome c [Burkholderiales bacterium]|nr:cytochrome c [Burkholderiales bacterium]
MKFSARLRLVSRPALSWLTACAIGTFCPCADAAEAAPAAARRAELIALVRQDCGSCHGLTLNGGLGPALLPRTLNDKPADSLKAVILYGRPGTAMPPWQRFLSAAEAAWIVAQLQKGFPLEK